MTKKIDQTEKKGRLGRRTFLKGVAATGGLAAGSGMMTGFPTIWAQNIKNVTLRQFGTGVSNINEIAKKVKEDLGFTLEMTALDTDTTAQRVVTQPKSFDIADIEYFTVKKVWGAGNLQPFDVSRLKNYDKIVGIFKNGKLTPTSKIARARRRTRWVSRTPKMPRPSHLRKPTGTPWCPPSTTRTPWGSVLTSSTGLSIPGPNC